MSSSESATPVSSATPTAQEPSTTQTSAGLDNWRLVALFVVALVAGVVGERATYLTRNYFYVLPAGMFYSADEQKVQDVNMFKNRAMGLAAYGATLLGLSGLLLGLSKGFVRGVVGCVAGIIVGAGVGCVIGPMGYYLVQTLSKTDIESIYTSVMQYFGQTPQDGTVSPMTESMLKSITLYSPLWLVLCVAMSVYAVVLIGPTKKLGRAILCGVIAALGGAIVHPLLAGLLFPGSHPELLLPDSNGGRVFGFVVGAVVAVLGVWGTYRR